VNKVGDDDETVIAQRTSPVSGGGLSTPHTNFGGAELAGTTLKGWPFGLSGRGSVGLAVSAVTYISWHKEHIYRWPPHRQTLVSDYSRHATTTSL
jgi:hypothetical protein